MILCAIAAMSQNFVIGKANQMPWHIPEDLKSFREKTLGRKLIMGRKTFESLGKPLPKRENIILTRQPDFQSPGIKVFTDLKTALHYCEQNSEKDEEVFIVGGAEIYELAAPYVQRLYLTRIESDFDGDAFFPFKAYESHLRLVSERPGLTSPSHRYLTFERRLA